MLAERGFFLLASSETPLKDKQNGKIDIFQRQKNKINSPIINNMANLRR